MASAEVPAADDRINPTVACSCRAGERIKRASRRRSRDAASNTTPRLREQQISEPKSRAGIAAETLAASPKAGQPPVGDGAISGSAMSASSPSTPKYTGEPISVNLKDVDLKDFFRLIHEISGLNIVLDPNVKGTVTLVLDDVPWDQALDIVLKNNGLDRELQGNVLRIAATDTLRRRRWIVVPNPRLLLWRWIARPSRVSSATQRPRILFRPSRSS